MKSYLRIKYFIDRLFAIFLIILSSPFFILGILIVSFGSNGKIFFKQKRIGLNGKFFTLYKFRTMKVSLTREVGQTNLSNPDIFFGGVFLRRYKIDELPQLLNILMGDMSFVGPRPFIPEIYKNMPNWAKNRTIAKPGLTGLAQINGNASLSWNDKWKYDLKYIDNCSYLLDIKILFITLLVVLLGEERFWKKI
tara:strand:- start:25 stop:606 length:582 start_codon:yes stop_codon:yes gene_type:complete